MKRIDYKIFIPFKGKKVENLTEKIKTAVHYNVDYKQGLNDKQVEERNSSGLSNKERDTVSTSYFFLIVKNIFTVLNVLLLTVAITLLVFKLYNRLFFVIILLLNIGISLGQDIKAKHLVNKLSLISNPKAEVMRNGFSRIIPFNEIVLSDIIVLKAGNTVPCDAKIVYGSIRVNESILSGETRSVNKNQYDLIYAESSVTSGTAYAEVIRISNANYAVSLQDKAKSFSRPSSEILKALKTLIRIISIIAISIGIVEIVSYSIHRAPLLDTVDAISSSIVAMIPSGMYLMTSITLTVGVIVLGKHNILVRELYSIEMLARVNVICLDKTGTLTDGNMLVSDLITIGKIEKKKLEKIIGQILYVTQDDNLTAKALKDKFATVTIEGDCASIPFDSEKKFSGASFNNKTYAIGAYKFLKVDNEKEIKKIIEKNELEGHRVLIIAEGKGNIKDNKLPNKLTCIGIAILTETIKKDARENIDWFKNNDVSARIISGDSPYALKSIALEVGFDGADKIISLEGKNDDEVREAAKKYFVFGRVSPEQKKIIIETLRSEGNTVAMIGDGVNDLLALKAADCSIAMAKGSDAAKAVAHLVSLDSNFSSLPKVVEQGRRVINNLQRVCSIFLVKTLFAMFFSILFTTIGFFKANIKYPFTTNNMFMWEVLMIGLAPFFIALEPNKDRVTRGFTANIIKETLPGAFAQIFVCLPILLTSVFVPSIFPFFPPTGNEKIAVGGVAMSVILFSVMSFVILLHVCLPINKYRRRVLIGTFILMVGVLCGDVVFNLALHKSSIISLCISYESINWQCLVLGICMFVATIPLYFIVARLLKKRLEKKKKE